MSPHPGGDLQFLYFFQFLVVLCFIAVVLLFTGIVAGVFRAQVGETMKTQPQRHVAYCIGLYRENAIAIESEARDANGDNVCSFSAASCSSQCK